MTRSAKRSADYIDYRSRSPKRRKTSAGRAQRDSTGTVRQTSRAYQGITSSSDSDTYPARAILKKRRVGRKIQYLIDWEPSLSTGETYEPSWVQVLHQTVSMGANRPTATRSQHHPGSDRRLGEQPTRKQERRRPERPDLSRNSSCQ